MSGHGGHLELSDGEVRYVSVIAENRAQSPGLNLQATQTNLSSSAKHGEKHSMRVVVCGWAQRMIATRLRQR